MAELGRSAAGPIPLNVVGEHITVLASAAQTGSYEIFVQGGPEGSGPAPHNHPWHEACYVLRGEVAFGVGDRESLANEGTLVQVPGVKEMHCVVSAIALGLSGSVD